jgi:hypothetical protein
MFICMFCIFSYFSRIFCIFVPYSAYSFAFHSIVSRPVAIVSFASHAVVYWLYEHRIWTGLGHPQEFTAQSRIREVGPLAGRSTRRLPPGLPVPFSFSQAVNQILTTRSPPSRLLRYPRDFGALSLPVSFAHVFFRIQHCKNLLQVREWEGAGDVIDLGVEAGANPSKKRD